MKKHILLLLPLLMACSTEPQVFIDDYPVATGSGTTLYVDSLSGNDTNDGKSDSSAWKSVAKVNAATLGSGTTVRFKRGGVWRERIMPQSGSQNGWTLYTDYGDGELPLFLGSVDGDSASRWSSSGANLWQYSTTFSDDIGNIFVSQTNALMKKWSLATLASQGDFYYNKSDKTLTVYSASNPADYYTGMELCTGQHMVYTENQSEWNYIGAMNISNVIFDHLAVRYGGAYAFKFQSTHHIQVLNCDISYCGGAELEGRAEVRYGNGVEFYGYAFFNKAISNTIYGMYDTGVSVQCVEGSPIACGIEFVGNTIYDCGLTSYELWFVWEPANTQAILSNIVFANNVCSNAGEGWGAQRPDVGGYHVLMDAALADTYGIVITNNRFENSKLWFFAMNTSFNGWEKADISHNHFVSTTNSKAYIAFDWHDHAVRYEYDFTQLSNYQAATGFGEGSTFEY